ncbi:LysR family transcriptional regulator [Jutongia sp.]
MELRNLKSFQLAAKYLNFTTVALELNYSQPTISSQIKMLEEELGQPLFTHIGKKTYLTPAGELLKKYADQIINLTEEAEEAFRNYSHPSGHLYVAGYESFCTNVFPHVLTKYLAFHSNVDIKLCSCPKTRAEKGVIDNKYDLGIISGSSDDPALDCIYLSKEPILCIVNQSLYEESPDINTLLKHYPLFVYRVDEHYSEMTDVYIEKNQLHPSKIVEFGSLPAIKKAVLSGIGVGIISAPVIRQELKQNILISLASHAEPVHVFSSLIILKSKAEWPNAQEFIELLLDTWDSAMTY